MSVQCIHFLVEEPSAERFLRQVLPALLPGIQFEIFSYQGKADLLKHLEDRLKGYAAWLPGNHRIVVLVDRDADDCPELKKKLEDAAKNARLGTRSRPNRGSYWVVNRIAVEELEAWYFGDWKAVRTAYPRVSGTIPNQAKFRKPDAITGGTWEALENIMQKSGYFRTGLRKIELAEAVGRYFAPARNTSPSFQAFAQALAELTK